MKTSKVTAGYFRSGLPYNRFGQAPRIAVVFQGLVFDNTPARGLAAIGIARMFRFLEAEYTTYIVTRKPGLPEGYSLQNMADDYAVMIREEFGGPVDVIGSSTGGSIAQHFAADHPDLVRRLVLHSSAYTLGEAGKKAQMRTGYFASQHKWKAAYAEVLRLLVPRNRFSGVVTSLGSLVMSFSVPKHPSDVVITIEAEDKHNFKDRLSEITAPTLVVAGDKDPFYTEALFRETAKGIPDARLILYAGMRHPAIGKQFERDVLHFLAEEMRTPLKSGVKSTKRAE